MKVYVVTRGEYSEYHICGLTTDEESAKKAKKFYSDDWCEAEIEVYDTDKFSSMENWKLFIVFFDKSGSVKRAEEIDRNDDYFVDRLADWEEDDYFHGEDFQVFATDKASAIKIAAEKRAVFLAKKEGLL